MEIINVTSRELLDELYEGGALALVGIESLTEHKSQTFADLLLMAGMPMSEDATVYQISGQLMNDEYGLTGTNAYKPDLNIICIKVGDLSGDVYAGARTLGARWFAEIVDDNAYREDDNAYREGRASRPHLPARRINQIITMVNMRVLKEEAGLRNEDEEYWYDSIMRNAQELFEKYDSWPVFDLMELD